MNRIYLLLLGFAMASCSSLEKSNLDQQLKVQGTYSCSAEPVIRPKNENPDAQVVRCFQDSVVVLQDEVRWNRVLYSKTNCTGDVQGSLHWRGTVLDVFADETNKQVISATEKQKKHTAIKVGKLSEEKIVRRNPHWYYDTKGGHCDLRNLPVNSEQYASQKWTCENFFPSRDYANKTQLIRFAWEEREGARILVGFWTGKDVACGR